MASDGTLTLEAGQIDLTSVFALQGIGNATFTSTGDLRLLPAASNYTNGFGATTVGNGTGALLTSGDLAFNAARIYPETDTSSSLKRSIHPPPPRLASAIRRRRGDDGDAFICERDAARRRHDDQSER